MLKINKPFRSVFNVLHPVYEHVYGVDQASWKDMGILHASAKSYGGTESVENGVLSVQTTKVVQCNYDKRLKASARLLDEYGSTWMIMGEPEDIEDKHRYMQFKIQKVEGGA